MANKPKLWIVLAAVAGLVISVACSASPSDQGTQATLTAAAAISGLAPAAALSPAVYATVTIPQTQVAFRPGPTAAAFAAMLPTTTGVPTPAATPNRAAAPARIRIVSLGIDAAVAEVGWHMEWRGPKAVGVWDTVRDAAGHHRGSADAGQSGNCVLSGHSSDESGAVFKRLEEAVPGQMVELEAQNGQSFVYVVETVVRLDELSASDVERREHAQWLEPTDGSTLTLVTCWPSWGYTHRLVVRAKLGASCLATALGQAETATATETPISKTKPASPTPVPCSSGLIISGVVKPVVAGPGEVIRLTVHVANARGDALHDVVVDGLLPSQIEFMGSDCQACTWSPATRRLTATIDRLPSDDQMLLVVTGRISQDAWPGRTVPLQWQAHAGGVVSCPATIAVELPWAEMPSTGKWPGGVSDGS